MDRSKQLLGLALSLPLASCINAQTGGTPRTLGPGKIQTVVGLDAQAFSGKQETEIINADGTSDSVSKARGKTVLTPLLPSVGVRIGAVEGVDVGLRLAAGTSIELNGKVNFLRTRYFDMAVMPGFTYLRVTPLDNDPFNALAGNGFLFQVPLLLGINVTPRSTILLNTGGAYMKAGGVVGNALNELGAGKAPFPDYAGEGTEENPTKTSLDQKARAPTFFSSAYVRAGFGFNQRIGARLSIQPEVTVLIAPTDSGNQIYNFGLGFNVGAQPAYTRGQSDEWSEDDAVDRPAAVDRSEAKTDIEDEAAPTKTKAPKLKVEQDPYEVEKEKKLAEEKKAAEESEKKRLEDEEKAAEEKKKKKKKK